MPRHDYADTYSYVPTYRYIYIYIYPTITPASVIVGHVMWYGHTEGSEQSLPITLTLKNGSIEVNYPQQTTNANGFFTVSTWLPPGMYDWRAKGPFGGANDDPHNTTGFLATSGMLALTSGLVQVEMGVQKTGDANGDNAVTLGDFNILRNSFGMFCGMAAYDNRADFTGNCIVSITDFSLLRYYFRAAGAPPIGPQGALIGPGKRPAIACAVFK